MHHGRLVHVLVLVLVLVLVAVVVVVVVVFVVCSRVAPLTRDIRPHQDNNAAIRKTKQILAQKPLPANWCKKQSSSRRSSRELASSRPMPYKAKQRVPGASLGSPWTRTI